MNMLYECHGHIILDGVAYRSAVARHRSGVNEAFVRGSLKICARNGVTFYRDGGDKHMVSAFAKTVAGEYGIDYRTPVYIIHKRGYYGSMFGRAFDSLSDYRALVEGVRREGGDFIKLTASSLLDFSNCGRVSGPEMSSAELNEMVRIAHGEGFAVMIHANGADNIKRSVESGADSIEHGFYMDDDSLLMMVQAGAVWVPTCATVLNLVGVGRYDDSMLGVILDGHKRALKKAQELGVLIACGSDAGASFVPQGAGTVDEHYFLNSLGVDTARGNRRIEAVFRSNF